MRTRLPSRGLAVMVLLALPAMAQAEISDKVPEAQTWFLLGLGQVVVAALMLLAMRGQSRWWALVSIIPGIALASWLWELAETDIRRAILSELGWGYVAISVGSHLPIVLAAVAGLLMRRS